MAASTRFLNKPWHADKVSPKTLKKKHKVIPKDANHEDGPEGEAWKKLPFRGRPIMMPLSERRQPEFFSFFRGKNQIILRQTENRSAESDFSLGADWKTHVRISKRRPAPRPFLPAFPAHGEFISSYSSDKGTAASCTRKVPTGLRGTAHHAARRTTSPSQMTGTTTFFFLFESGKTRENRSKSS